MLPHGQNLLARATKPLRNSLDVAMGQLAAVTALEEHVYQSASVIFVQISPAYRPSRTSSKGHCEQTIGEDSLQEILLFELRVPLLRMLL